MAPDKLKVVLAGSSGETGRSIMNQLLASPSQFEVVALVRPETADKEIYKDFSKRGAVIKAVNFNDTQAVAALLTGIDVVISCLILLQQKEEESLIDASHQAGVGRFIPSFWAICCPPRGVMALRERKEDILDRCKRLYLPYTAIDVGWWYQSSIPRVPSGRLDKATTMPDSTIMGDGNARSALTDISDIGKYVVRIIADPRTLNRLVFAYSEVTTQNAVFSMVEELTGETIPRTHMSKEQADESIRSASEILAQSPHDMNALFKMAMTQYGICRGIREDNTPEHAKYLGYLDAKELYPDVEYTSIKDFVRQVVEGSRTSTVYVGREPHIPKA